METMYLCPNCMELCDEMVEAYNEVNSYTVRVGKCSEFKECHESEHILTRCLICKKEFEGWRAEDFLVLKREKKLFPVGEYWQLFKEDLEDYKGEK